MIGTHSLREIVKNNNLADFRTYLQQTITPQIESELLGLLPLAQKMKNIEIIAAIIESISISRYTYDYGVANLLFSPVIDRDLDFLNKILPHLPIELINEHGYKALEISYGSEATPLHQGMVDRLLEYPIIQFHDAVAKEDVSTISELLNKHLDLIDNECRINALRTGIEKNNLNLVQTVLLTIESINEYAQEHILRQSPSQEIYQLIQTYWKSTLIETLKQQLSTRNIANEIIKFFEHIFLPREETLIPKATLSRNTQYNNYDVIENFSGYYNSRHVHFNTRKGRPLKLQIQHKSIPIGYRIIVPEEPIQATIINIYGGHQAKKRETLGSLDVFYVPTEEDLNLMKNGIALVFTRLCDLLELNEFQSKMPKKLFDHIHRSINCLYMTLQDTPTSLDHNLSKLKGIPFFLRGSSFGGLMSVRYAQLATQEPKRFRPFQGYLSFNGALSNKMLFNSDLPCAGVRDYRTDFLNPFNHIDFVNDPILVIQSLDDNNVNSKVAFHFVNEAHKKGLQHLVRMHIVKKGNAVIDETANSNDPDSVMERELSKGHLSVSDPEEFSLLQETIIAFIKKPVSVTPNVNAWREFTGNIKANNYYRQSTPEEKFTAYVFKAKDTLSTKALLAEIQNDVLWENNYKPIYLAFVHAQNLYQFKSALDNEKQKLKEQNLLTDDIIITAFKNKAGALLDYLSEFYHFSTQHILADDFIRLPIIIEAFRTAINQASGISVRFLFEQLYVNNTNLLSEFIDKIDEGSTYSTQMIKNGVDLVRNQLIHTLQEKRGHLLMLWKQASQQALLSSQVSIAPCSSSCVDDIEPSRKHSLGSRLQPERKCKRFRR